MRRFVLNFFGVLILAFLVASNASAFDLIYADEFSQLSEHGQKAYIVTLRQFVDKFQAQEPRPATSFLEMLFGAPALADLNPSEISGAAGRKTMEAVSPPIGGAPAGDAVSAGPTGSCGNAGSNAAKIRCIYAGFMITRDEGTGAKNGCDPITGDLCKPSPKSRGALPKLDGVMQAVCKDYPSAGRCKQGSVICNPLLYGFEQTMVKNSCVGVNVICVNRGGNASVQCANQKGSEKLKNIDTIKTLVKQPEGSKAFNDMISQLKIQCRYFKWSNNDYQEDSCPWQDSLKQSAGNIKDYNDFKKTCQTLMQRVSDLRKQDKTTFGGAADSLGIPN